MSNPNVTINRHKYIGGSDLPSILGFNQKYGKSVYLFAKEKAGIIPNDFKGNEYTRYGQLMEPIIRDYINSKYNANYLEDTTIDEIRGYRGNTDGIDRNAVYKILEVKTFGEKLDVDYYEPQCQFYMETFNVDSCILVGYKRPSDFYTGIDYELEHDDFYFNTTFDPNNLFIHHIKRDENKWNKIETQILKFKEIVKYLKENPDTTEMEFNEIFYGSELITKSNELNMVENQLSLLKDLETKSKKIKEDIYKIMEEKDIISFETDNIKITKVSPTEYETISIDSNKLKEDYEDIYEKYKVIKSTKRKGYVLITLKGKDVK